MPKQTAADLQHAFAIRDHLSFHDSPADSNTGAGGLVEMRIVTAHCEATLYTYGAHLTRWNPRGEQPVLFLSPRSEFVPGKAIRGGVPVLFPWFGPRWDGGPAGVTSPSHGFARTSEWTVESTHLAPTGEVQVVLRLEPDANTQQLGYPSFIARVRFHFASDLVMALEVENTGDTPLVFEEGLHTYFAVSDIDEVRIDGLRGSTYIDKRDDNTRKVQRETQLAITRDLDQVHVATEDPLTLHDPGWQRRIVIEKTGSRGTVVWNPWSTLTPGLKDLAEDSWRHFVCVETVNTGDERIHLQPGAEPHSMGCRVYVERA